MWEVGRQRRGRLERRRHRGIEVGASPGCETVVIALGVEGSLLWHGQRGGK